MKKFKPFTKDEVVFKIDAEQDDLSVKGNLIDNGNEELDKQDEDAVIKRLNDGDIWAWASVRVTATLNTENDSIKGYSYLGCCSYDSEEDFKNDVYYEDMCEEALKNLNDGLEMQFKFLMNRVVEE